MITNEKVEKIIEAVRTVQNDGSTLPCPRCGHDRMHKEMVMNSLSRYADVYICSECGTDEAMRDMGGIPLPLNKWSVVTSFPNDIDN